MPRKLSIEGVAYWGTAIFAAITMGYLLITLINLSTQEETALQSTTNYREQVRFVTVLTSEGSFKIAFLRSQAPLTVKNFVRLAQSGFYDQTEFYNFRDGVFVENATSSSGGIARGVEGEISRAGQIFEGGTEDTKIARGLVAMPARSGSKVDSRQLLFFIEDEPSALGEGYAVFGRVIEGMEVVDRIRGLTPTKAKSAEVESVSLESIVVD